jgi:hypothetical protein
MFNVSSPEGQAKFWIEPVGALADYSGLSDKQIRELVKVVEKNVKDIEKAWKNHFGSN